MIDDSMVTTIFGPMPKKQLRRETSVDDNPRLRTTVVVYWLGNQCVHRSTHIELKVGLGIEGTLGAI